MKQKTSHQHYHHQIEKLSARIKQLESKSEQFASWRLYTALMIAALFLLLFFVPYPLFVWASLSMGILLFMALLVIHQHVEKALSKFRIWRSLKEEARARMLHDWKAIPETAISGKATPLENDFDLRELHRLLNTASSYAGTKRLHQWLMNPLPDLQVIEQRQRLVLELRTRPSFRDKLSLAARLSSSSIRGQIHLGALHDWLDSAVPMQSFNFWLMVLGILALVNAVVFILTQFGILPTIVLAISWELMPLFI